MSRMCRIGVDNAVSGRIIARSVHGIGPGLIQGGLFLVNCISYFWIGHCRTGNLTSRVVNPVILTILLVD